MITFDVSIEEFAKVLTGEGLDVSESSGVFVRDLRGRLIFVARKKLLAETIEKVATAANLTLRPYVSPLGPVADQSAPGTSGVFSSTEAVRVKVRVPGRDQPIDVALLDRRAMGADWLYTPLNMATTPPRLVFSSLKGGVGRSTALSVLAAELAERGRSVLVLDLDLEAPGLGSMLIESTATPKFGALDLFVEDALQELDNTFLIDCIGSSWLGGGRGRVDVVPSYGAVSLNNPRDVTAKIARAYLEGSKDKEITFLKRVQSLVQRLSEVRRYDAVLVDTRAGLHETTPTAILGLGADVLLFGVDQPQTVAGYRILLSNVAQLPVADSEHDWRYRLRMVQAKADSSEVINDFRSHMFDVFDDVFYSGDIVEAGDVFGGGFRFSIDDPDAPHFPVPIFEDEGFRLFDPVQHRAQLTKPLYESSFGEFIRFCVQRLQLDEDAGS
jgi:hypothetical protein